MKTFDIIIIGSGPGAAGFIHYLLNQNQSIYKTKAILIIEAGTNSIYDANHQDLHNIHQVKCKNGLKNQHLRANCVGGGATINASIYVAPSIKEKDTCFPYIQSEIRNHAYDNYLGLLDDHIFKWKSKHESGYYLYQIFKDLSTTRYEDINSRTELSTADENTFGNVSSLYNDNKTRVSLIEQLWQANNNITLLSNTKVKRLKLLDNGKVRVITNGLSNFEAHDIVCAAGVFGTPELLVASKLLPSSTVFSFFDRPRLAFMYKFPQKQIWDNTPNEGYNFYYLNRLTNEIYEYMLRNPYKYQAGLELIGESTTNLRSKLEGAVNLLWANLVNMAPIPQYMFSSLNKYLKVVSSLLNVTINPMFDDFDFICKFEVKNSGSKFYPYVTKWGYDDDSKTRSFYKKAIRRFMKQEHKKLIEYDAKPMFDEDYEYNSNDLQTHWHYGGSMVDHIDSNCMLSMETSSSNHRIFISDMSIAKSNNRANTHGLAHLCGNMAAACYSNY